MYMNYEPVADFLSRRVAVDPRSHIASVDMIAEFNRERADRGLPAWTRERFVKAARLFMPLAAPGVQHMQIRPRVTMRSKPDGSLIMDHKVQVKVWYGARFRPEA